LGAENSEVSESFVTVAVTNSPALTFSSGLKLKEMVPSLSGSDLNMVALETLTRIIAGAS
jgi:hypothetical protein